MIQISNQLNSKTNRTFNTPLSLYFIGIISYHLYILILAANFHKDKISSGEIVIELPKYFGFTFHNNLYIHPYFKSVIILAIISIFIIWLALYYRESYFFRKHTLAISIIYGIFSTMLWEKATGNLVILFINFFLGTSLYFYWIRFGKITSFFENPIVQFSILRSLSLIPLIISTSLFYFMVHNYFADPYALATSNIRIGREGTLARLLLQYGLVDEEGNKIPIWIRYIDWMNNMMYGNFGNSYINGKSISDQFYHMLWESSKLIILAFVLSTLIGGIIGVIAANYHKSRLDVAIRTMGLIGSSMPIFYSGILFILIFSSIGVNWYPSKGAHNLPIELAGECELCYNEPEEYFSNYFMKNWGSLAFWFNYFKIWWIHTTDSLHHLVLPLLSITFVSMCTFSRFTRSSILNIMNEDYIIAAKANGLPKYDILRRHAFKIFSLNILPYLCGMLGFLIISTPIIETVFMWPGFGLYLITALGPLDVPIILFLTMFITIIMLFINLAVDVVYVYLDPRITLGR